MDSRPKSDKQRRITIQREKYKTERAHDREQQGRHDLDEDESIYIIPSPRDRRSDDNEPWLPFVRIGAKETGANNPGPDGGIYGIPSGDGESFTERAMFKRDTVTEKGGKENIRVGKIIGEYVAGNLLANLLRNIHQSDDPDYTNKYVAVVQLVKARSKESNNDVESTYLKSIFLKNYRGDFWEVALVDHHATELSKKQEIPLKQALRSSGLQGSSEQISQLATSLAKTNIVGPLYGRKKPNLVKQSFFGKYHDPAISIPAQMLANPKNELLLQDFCEQVAARLLVADYGLHAGNFGVVDDKSGTLRMGSFDYGAGLCNLLPEVKPFARFGTGTKFYKNHLLEYHPNIIKSEVMAEAFIRMGQVDDNQLGIMVDHALRDLINSETYTSVEPIKKFCKRMGMPERGYESVTNMLGLINNMREFMEDRLKSRKLSLLHKGYGLLIEHCMGEKEFDLPKLKAMIKEHRGLVDYILSPALFTYDAELENKHTGMKEINTKILKVIQQFVRDNYSQPAPTEPSRQLQEIKPNADELCRKIYDVKDQIGRPEIDIGAVAEQYEKMQKGIQFWYEKIREELTGISTNIKTTEDEQYLTGIRISIEKAIVDFHSMDDEIKRLQKLQPANKAAPAQAPQEESYDSLLNELNAFNDIMSDALKSFTATASRLSMKPEKKPDEKSVLTKSGAGKFSPKPAPRKGLEPKQTADEVKKKKNDGTDQRPQQSRNKK